MHLPPWPVATERERELLDEVLRSGQWGGFHPFIARFESEFAAFQHAAHCVSAMNGTVTLEMGLMAAGIGPGDEVIVPAISFISSATAISRVGSTPVFVDIEPATYNIDPIRAALAITPKTKAILAVHFGGPMANMDRLQELADAFQLMLLEDAAHAQGSEWDGRRAGSLGAWGSFSFQNGKVITAGEGGAVVTNDAALAERMRSFANQGRRADGPSFFHHFTLGTNLRMTAFQAAVLIAQLERLPEQIALRNRNAKILIEALQDVPGVELQRAPTACNRHGYYLLVGHARNRDRFVEKVAERGVPITPFYPHTLYENPLYAARDSCVVHECPVAEASVRDSFWLPHRVLMADGATTLEVAEILRRSAS
jgi:dTDP-4-amino-4,6-dideoxygalactose transaminase